MGHDTATTAMRELVRLGPKAAAMAKARMMPGNDSTRSQMRMRISSTALPK